MDSTTPPISASIKEWLRGADPEVKRSENPGTLTKNEKTRPAMEPPMVSSSGRMRSSKSVQKRATMTASKTHHFKAARLGPYSETARAKRTAVASSTRK